MKLNKIGYTLHSNSDCPNTIILKITHMHIQPDMHIYPDSNPNSGLMEFRGATQGVLFTEWVIEMFYFPCRYTAKLMEYVSDHFLTSAHIHQARSFPALVPSLERRHKPPSGLRIPAAPQLNWILNKCQSEFYINTTEHRRTSYSDVRVSGR